MNSIWTVYFQSADSYHSVAEFPRAAFESEELAIEFASAQKGYGYGYDWFVKEIPFNVRVKVCAVCHNPIDGEYYHHNRLNVDIHIDCPMNNVMGEDITFHCVSFGNTHLED